jgi:hypothetical protein
MLEGWSISESTACCTVDFKFFFNDWQYFILVMKIYNLRIKCYLFHGFILYCLQS